MSLDDSEKNPGATEGSSNSDDRSGHAKAPKKGRGRNRKRNSRGPRKGGRPKTDVAKKDDKSDDSSQVPAAELTQNVYIIGFMGAGKSTVARKIARRLGVASLDMDKYIERSQGMRIKEIFEQQGESGFRRIEHETLEEIASSGEPKLISCGGGVVIDPANRELMKESGKVIHLKVTADEAARRISDKSSRPLFNDMESARNLCRDRMPMYEDAANHTIVTKRQGPSRIANEVIEWLKGEGVICQQPG